ncbi:MAG: hypothetical protein DBX55_06720 [Verrucomicrobia bacterium]|nr:MAG: hypothetical protein DBX55_06720 [Verrucomicrobiota bacterium]
MILRDFKYRTLSPYIGRFFGISRAPVGGAGVGHFLFSLPVRRFVSRFHRRRASLFYLCASVRARRFTVYLAKCGAHCKKIASIFHCAANEFSFRIWHFALRILYCSLCRTSEAGIDASAFFCRNLRRPRSLRFFCVHVRIREARALKKRRALRRKKPVLRL